MNSIQLTIGEFEISLYVNRNEFAGLVHFGESTVDCEYEFEPGQREIIRADPDDSQPGWPDSITICSIKTTAPLNFEAEGIALTIESGQDIFHLLSKRHVEELQDEILKSMTEDAYA